MIEMLWVFEEAKKYQNLKKKKWYKWNGEGRRINGSIGISGWME